MRAKTYRSHEWLGRETGHNRANGIRESANDLAEAHCEEMNRPLRARTLSGVGGASE